MGRVPSGGAQGVAGGDFPDRLLAADAKTNQGIGYDQAVADSIKASAANIAVGAEVEQQANADHAAKKDDTAFDPDFIRKD